ncbi:MAG TPA: Uma2 family endonuclease [Actinocrinis sp.]|nr:Uma2 family endonuclease [Actinocrinis sp.]
MSAEPIEYQEDGNLLGPWARFRPPEGGWTTELVDRIPDLPPHTELIDGSLVFVSPQKAFHNLVLFVMATQLRHQTPAELRVRQEAAIRLDKHNRPEPDLFVIHKNGITGLAQTTFLPDHIKLVVEVESPESKMRDRRVKPSYYAEAGIAHFWRVEDHSDEAVVFAYELIEEAGEYKLTGEHRGRFVVDSPFPVEIDLTEIRRL